MAESLGVAWFPSFRDIPANQRPEGVVVSTPNQMHVANGLECIESGVAALVEKPLADDLAGAQTLVDAAERKGVPLLTGHHRRHNPMIQRAKAEIDSGRLGRLVSVHGMFWLLKPDDYFDLAWRREKGAGPVLLNLIHDVDLLRYLVGEVETVQAARSNRVRGNEIEDTAVIILRFANGALGTVNVSDTIQAPWSWEFTTGENPA
jgi:predicted dehydrogenase